MQTKGKILNAQLAGVIVGLGHRDRIVVTDAGLPLPRAVPVLDLSVVENRPRLVEVLGPVLNEMKVDTAYCADRFADASPGVYAQVVKLLDGIELRPIPQADLEEMMATAKLVVRTGEFSHFANLVLVAGVTF